jgi:CRP/FNR family transcriptional regulator, cyclic AMP receptor protein
VKSSGPLDAIQIPHCEEIPWHANQKVLKHVPLFALLDEEETAVLAAQVELKTFAPRQRIYKIGDSSGRAYVVVSGRVRVSTVDQEHQEVVVDEPSHGEFFGFASMLEQTPHQTEAVAIDEAVCIEVEQEDIAVLLERKPLAGMDMLRVLGPAISCFAAAGAAAGQQTYQ